MNLNESFTIDRTDDCKHSNLTISLDTSVVEYCPKGCDGEAMVDMTITCDDCQSVIHEIHSGHEGCKYGR